MSAETNAPTVAAPAGRRTRAARLPARLLAGLLAGSTGFWAAALLVTAFAGVLRFWHLDEPHALVFDETYYVKEGLSMLQAGYELAWDGKAEDVNARLLAGSTDLFTDQPEFVAHPPLGKWMIAAGQALIGPTSAWGWRFSAALVGTASVLLLILIARRLFASNLLAVTAGLLLAVDGHHFVLSRTGLLDVFVMFWALSAFACLLVDRDVGRRRLQQRLPPGGLLRGHPGIGPGLGVRWWRLAAAVCLGLCTGVKWSGVFFALAFGLGMLSWDLAARRAAGVRGWLRGGLLRDGLPAVALMVPVYVLTYLACWTGWFLSRDAWGRQWAVENPSARFDWVPASLRSLWHFHTEIYHFNVTLRSEHPYKANPWSWIVMGRPTAFFYETRSNGDPGCTVDTCSRAILALGNPVIWWGGTLAVAVLLFSWALARDWRAGAILIGLAGGYLPWFLYQDRTVYNFYAVAFAPWVALGLTYLLALWLGPPPPAGAPRLRAVGPVLVVAAAVGMFWFFLPVLDASVIPQPAWSNRMWLPSWI